MQRVGCMTDLDLTRCRVLMFWAIFLCLEKCPSSHVNNRNIILARIKIWVYHISGNVSCFSQFFHALPIVKKLLQFCTCYVLTLFQVGCLIHGDWIACLWGLNFLDLHPMNAFSDIKERQTDLPLSGCRF